MKESDTGEMTFIEECRHYRIQIVSGSKASNLQSSKVSFGSMKEPKQAYQMQES